MRTTSNELTYLHLIVAVLLLQLQFKFTVVVRSFKMTSQIRLPSIELWFSIVFLAKKNPQQNQYTQISTRGSKSKTDVFVSFRSYRSFVLHLTHKITVLSHSLGIVHDFYESKKVCSPIFRSSIFVNFKQQFLVGLWGEDMCNCFTVFIFFAVVTTRVLAFFFFCWVFSVSKTNGTQENMAQSMVRWKRNFRVFVYRHTTHSNTQHKRNTI